LLLEFGGNTGLLVLFPTAASYLDIALGTRKPYIAFIRPYYLLPILTTPATVIEGELMTFGFLSVGQM